MMSILFVDDEPRVLGGLERLLRPRRREWKMTFADGGERALEVMSKEPFTVIVSDLRMPGMNGATLLKRVAVAHPETMRVVLSGQADEELCLAAALSAHRVMAKPCQADELQRVIEHASSLSTRLTHEGLRRVVGGITGMRSLAASAVCIDEILRSPEPSIERLRDVLERDVALTAKLLHVGCSGIAGVTGAFRDVHSAVTQIGVSLTCRIASTITGMPSVVDMPDSASTCGCDHHHRSVIASRVARSLASESHASNAHIAALLHDIGQLVLAGQMPDACRQVREQARTTGDPVTAIERQVFGASHADVGAYLLSLWGFPDEICFAVEHHHDALDYCTHESEPLHVAFAARAYVDAYLERGDGGADWATDVLPTEYLRAVGGPGWAEKIIEKVVIVFSQMS